MTSERPSAPDFFYGTAWKENRTAGLTELALRVGFRGIDTANQRRHYFEAGVGQGLAAAYRAGVVARSDVFLQTKFTYQSGQDHRLPYNPAARPSAQVTQSLTSSLEHLGTDYVDSFVLHGPSLDYSWSDADAEVWEAMCKERQAGRTRFLGVSNVSLRHLEQMTAAHGDLPAFVQNRLLRSAGLGPRGSLVLPGAEDALSGIFASYRECRSAAPSSGTRARSESGCDSRSGCFQLRTQDRDAASDWYL